MTRLGRGHVPVAFGNAATALALALSLYAGLKVGDVPISATDLLRVLYLGPQARLEEAFLSGVVWQIRLPRAIAAAMSGGVLAICGVIFQGVLRNPLAEPYTLGVAGGAAFGAACAIVAGLPWVTPLAFAGSIATLLVVWVLGARRGERDATRIVLAGVIVGSILGAGLTLIKALAGEKIAAIVIWLMGSFAAANWLDVPPLGISLILLILLASMHARELDIMGSGVEAAALGVDLPRTRLLLLGGASLAVSLVVSRFGVIGFVGLVVPHLLRLLFGPAHRDLLPLSFLGGAALLCAADTAAKVWNEIPVGVLTVLIGGPIFCLLLWRKK